MNRDIEISLIQQCHEHGKNRTTTASSTESQSDTIRYRSQERFTQEMKELFSRQPIPVLHNSEVSEVNQFRAVQTPMGNLIVSRDKSGQAHIFHNICRHRGATLVHDSESAQCNKLITCPYHAWSYIHAGKLHAVPGQNHCFPNLDKAENSLLEVPSIEKYGFIWACPDLANDYDKETTTWTKAQAESHLDGKLGSLVPELDWLKLNELSLFKRQTKVWSGNWKLFMEGGIETYHFTYAHKNTIGPAFMNNTAVIDVFDEHLRVVMPTKMLKQEMAKPKDQQKLRHCAHIVYSIFPSNALLVQHEHIDWISFRPVTHDRTEISVTSLVPSATLDTQREHWQRNHEITTEVLNEDFVLGEGIQNSMSSDMLSNINYGRNEWALKKLNDLIDLAITE